jgi:hypothetical protein
MVASAFSSPDFFPHFGPRLRERILTVLGWAGTGSAPGCGHGDSQGKVWTDAGWSEEAGAPKGGGDSKDSGESTRPDSSTDSLQTELIPESGDLCRSGNARPFLVRGEARLAQVTRRRDWLGSVALGAPLGQAEIPSRLEGLLARAYLEDARMAHASVAAFACFSLELLSFGAPAELVLASQQAGADEVRHAQICFALAAFYSGKELGPSGLNTQDVKPAVSLRESVLTTFLEGCIGKTLAAARTEAALVYTRCPATRARLARSADDEARHAELAYRFVSWALKRADPSLRGEVGACFEEARARAASAGGQTTAAGSHLALELSSLEEERHWRALGRLTPADELRVARDTWRDVIAPCAHQLLADSPRSAS